MRILADVKRVAGLIDALASQVQEAVSDGPSAIVGIRNRGDILANRLAAKLQPDHVGALDITLYRDDLSEIGPQAVVQTTEISFPIDGTNVLLVDDVLMTGRSIRAAMQSLIDFGRPRRIWLCVLVDRGGRELPIAPDYVGLDLAGELGRQEHVAVELEPLDPRDAIVVGEPAKESTSA